MKVKQLVLLSWITFLSYTPKPPIHIGVCPHRMEVSVLAISTNIYQHLGAWGARVHGVFISPMAKY